MPNATNTSTVPTGTQVKHRLLDIGKRQAWLIEKMKEKDNTMFMDSGYMARLLSGQETSAPKMALIDQILTEEEERQNGHRN